MCHVSQEYLRIVKSFCPHNFSKDIVRVPTLEGQVVQVAVPRSFAYLFSAALGRQSGSNGAGLGQHVRVGARSTRRKSLRIQVRKRLCLLLTLRRVVSPQHKGISCGVDQSAVFLEPPFSGNFGLTQCCKTATLFQSHRSEPGSPL